MRCHDQKHFKTERKTEKGKQSRDSREVGSESSFQETIQSRSWGRLQGRPQTVGKTGAGNRDACPIWSLLGILACFRREVTQHRPGMQSNH